MASSFQVFEQDFDYSGFLEAMNQYSEMLSDPLDLSALEPINDVLPGTSNRSFSVSGDAPVTNSGSYLSSPTSPNPERPRAVAPVYNGPPAPPKKNQWADYVPRVLHSQEWKDAQKKKRLEKKKASLKALRDQQQKSLIAKPEACIALRERPNPPASPTTTNMDTLQQWGPGACYGHPAMYNGTNNMATLQSQPTSPYYMGFRQNGVPGPSTGPVQQPFYNGNLVVNNDFFDMPQTGMTDVLGFVPPPVAYSNGHDAGPSNNTFYQLGYRPPPTFLPTQQANIDHNGTNGAFPPPSSTVPAVDALVHNMYDVAPVNFSSASASASALSGHATSLSSPASPTEPARRRKRPADDASQPAAAAVAAADQVSNKRHQAEDGNNILGSRSAPFEIFDDGLDELFECEADQGVLGGSEEDELDIEDVLLLFGD